ncbi:sulfite exporter TauE/SafE family protein [Achromobacter denitrificans]
MMETLLLCAAAFIGGALNTIAGGGSFLTLPALMFIGVPAVAANATGAVALLPGYLAGALSLGRGRAAQRGLLPLGELAVLACAGGALGAYLLTRTGDAALRGIVPWMMLLATALFMAGPAWIARRTRGKTAEAEPSAAGLRAGLFVASIYGGYFNGGMGILLLALFALAGQRDLHAMNQAKNWASAVLTLMAACVYSAGGAIDWPRAMPMMAAGALGGWAGGRLAHLLPMAVVRRGVIATGLAMTAALFL